MNKKLKDAFEVFAIIIIGLLLLSFNWIFVGWILPLGDVSIATMVLHYVCKVVITLLILFIQAVILVSIFGEE